MRASRLARADAAVVIEVAVTRAAIPAPDTMQSAARAAIPRALRLIEAAYGVRHSRRDATRCSTWPGRSPSSLGLLQAPKSGLKPAGSGQATRRPAASLSRILR